MGLQERSLNRYRIICDDPYNKGCSNQFNAFGPNRVERLAQEDGWYKSLDTCKYACPGCIGLHRTNLKSKVASNSSITREQAGRASDSGDPLTAYFITSLLGGDPFAAGVTTFLTGDTTLGVFVGMMWGGQDKAIDEQQFVPGGGDSGGAGASDRFDQTQSQIFVDGDQPQTPPIIVDPYPEDRTQDGMQGVVADMADTRDNNEAPVPEDSGVENSGSDDSANSEGVAY